MNVVKKVTDDIFWIGGSDKRLARFENIFPIPEGVSYNSYFVDDEKTVVFDTADISVSEVMTARVDIDVIDIDDSKEEIMNKINLINHSN